MLRCYARPEGNYILGVCIDLNLAVRGDNIEQVKNEMTKAIKLYFSCLDKENFQDLFPRPSPLIHKLDFYRVCFLVKVLHLTKFISEGFQIFREQIIPKEFSVIPCA